MIADIYQKNAAKTCLKTAWEVRYLTLGLTGEAGEIANKVKKVYRNDGGVFDTNAVEGIIDEIGDVLWYAAVLSEMLGYNLSTVMKLNINKLNNRKDTDTLKIHD